MYLRLSYLRLLLMKNFITEYLYDSNELSIKFNITQNTTKLVYSFYGNNGNCIKGLIENGINFKSPKFRIDVENANIFFIKTKSVIDNEIVDYFEFVNLNSIKQKINLNMSILDKKTDNLFKSINMDDLEIKNLENNSNSKMSMINTNQKNINLNKYQNRFTGLIIEGDNNEDDEDNADDEDNDDDEDNEENTNSGSEQESDTDSKPDDIQLITDNSDNDNSDNDNFDYNVNE